MERLIISIVVMAALALPAQAECYLDYKAKQDDPLRLHYGVAQISDAVCENKKAARAEMEPRLAVDGWTLIKIMGFFGPDGLNERKASAGDYFLRY
jgi:hypothetical protein